MTFIARLGRAVYGLLTSVRFAAVQIVAIALAGVVGIVVPQLPAVAFRSPADDAEQVAILRARLATSGELSLVGRADRYVDLRREFGRLLEDVVSRRGDT